MRLLNLTFLLLTGSLSLAAVAETRYTLGGDVPHLTRAEAQGCVARLAEVKAAAERLHSPSWHFVVVCGDGGWWQYAALSKRSALTLENVVADTDLASRTTFLRADGLTPEIEGAVERVMAHEVASILLNTTDEAAIRRKVAALLPERSESVMAASR